MKILVFDEAEVGSWEWPTDVPLPDKGDIIVAPYTGSVADQPRRLITSRMFSMAMNQQGELKPIITLLTNKII